MDSADHEKVDATTILLPASTGVGTAASKGYHVAKTRMSW